LLEPIRSNNVGDPIGRIGKDHTLSVVIQALDTEAEARNESRAGITRLR